MRRISSNRTWKELKTISDLRGREHFVKDISCHGPSRVALIFPNTYDVASASLSYHDLFYRMNIPEDVGCERFFYDETARSHFSLDSPSVISDFRIWAFSVHFEMDLLNVLFMLHDLGVPLNPRERSEKHPIIIIGGSLSLFMKSALEYVGDYVYEGELAEGFVENLAKLKLEEHTRQSAIAFLDNYSRTGSHLSEGILSNHAESSYLTPNSVFPNRFLLEISRGCRHRCAFCVMGHTFGGSRHLPYSSIEESLSQAMNHTKKVGLVAAEVNDHPDIDKVAQFALENELDLSVSSLRADSLSGHLLKALRSGSQKQFTIAPEGGSQKVRNLLGKALSSKDIEIAFRLGRDAGFERIKLYFIYDVPGEDGNDLQEISSIVSFCRDIGYSRISVSLNPLIPKPGTLFEGYKMSPISELKEKRRLLMALLNMEGVKADFESIRESVSQYVISNMNDDIYEGLAECVQNREKKETFRYLINQSLTISGKRKEWVRNGKEEHTCC